MITEEIKIIVDSKQAEKNVQSLDNSLGELNKQSGSVAQGMKESTTSVLDNGGAMGLLNALTGGYAQVAKDSVEAMALFAKESKLATFAQSTYSLVVGGSTGAMKLFRLALASTGIGLIVLALVSLVLNFSKVTDVVGKLIPGLKLVGEFFTTVINAVTDFVGITSEAERELEKFNEQAKKSLKANEDYLQTRGDLLDKYTTKKIEAKNKYLKALEEENLGDEKRKDLAKRLNRDLANIDKERVNDAAKIRKDAQDKIDAKNKAESDKAKAKAEADENTRVENVLKERQKLFDESAKFQDEQETININNAERLRRKKDSELLTDIERRQAGVKAILDLDKKEAEDKIILEQSVKDAKIGIANQTLSLISEIAGRGSKIGKAIAVAQATISGIQGVQNAYSTAQKSPITALFPAYPLVQAGLAGAFSALQIKNILATNIGSGGSPNTNTQGASAPSAPSFNLVQGTGANQIATSIAGQNRPIQAYVVSSNVTTAQSLDRNIIANSKL